MKTSTNAALLSAFIFPGSGHLYLKHYFAGAVFIAITSATLFIIVSDALRIANVISEKIVSGEIAMDVAVVRKLIEQESVAQPEIVQYAIGVLIVTWLIAILDSYRRAIKQGRAHA